LRLIGATMSDPVSVSDDELNAKLEQWKKWNYYPCGTVFGPIAQEYGLSFVDATILSWLRYLSKSTHSSSILHNGLKYVWLHYQTALEHNPMMGITNKLVFGRHIGRMEKLGILLRFDQNESDSSRSYFRVPPDLEYFIYATIDHGTDLERICSEWIQWKKTGEVPSAVEKVSVDKPVFTSLTERFVEFVDTVKSISKFKPNLYDKDGEPFKGMLVMNQWYDALLDGTFATKFKPSNPDYDYTTIGAVTEQEMLRAIQKAPAFVDKLPQYILAYKTKRSMLLDAIVAMRDKVGHTIGSTAKQLIVSDDDKVAMQEDKRFQEGLMWIKKMNSAFLMSAQNVLQLWEIHKWYKTNFDDLKNMPNNKDFAYNVGRDGIYKMGEFLGTYSRTTGKPVMPQDLKVDSYWWQRFALYMLKSHSCKIIFDEGVYRRTEEAQSKHEQLYEARPSDYQSP